MKDLIVYNEYEVISSTPLPESKDSKSPYTRFWKALKEFILALFLFLFKLIYDATIFFLKLDSKHKALVLGCSLLGFSLIASSFLSTKKVFLVKEEFTIGNAGKRDTVVDTIMMTRNDTVTKVIVKKVYINEAAPAEPSELPNITSNQYIAMYKDIAIQEMKKYGIPASITLAQGLLESRAGKSKLAVQNNNHFGIKCFSKNCKKGHCTNFTDDSHKDFFRKFPSVKASYDAHSQLLTSGRYAKLKKYGRNYKAWAHGLKAVGYASDKTYDTKIIQVIEKYDLNKFDK